jgi:hypothetical protein
MIIPFPVLTLHIYLWFRADPYFRNFFLICILFCMIVHAKNHQIMKIRLNEAWNSPFLVETLPKIGFHTLSLMNSTYPSTIWDKSSASFAHAIAQYSMSEKNPVYEQSKWLEEHGFMRRSTVVYGLYAKGAMLNDVMILVAAQNNNTVVLFLHCLSLGLTKIRLRQAE